MVSKGKDTDTYTTGGDYAKDILLRTEWYRAHGYPDAPAPAPLVPAPAAPAPAPVPAPAP